MINDIIQSLLTDNDLTKSLLKTLVFARRIGNEELASWVSDELNGYPHSKNLPAYRFAKSNVQGVMSQNGRQTPLVSLPLTCFGDEAAEMLIKKGFSESISMLEDLVKNTEDKYLGKEFSADMLQFLTQQAQNNGCNFSVVSCRQLVMLSEVAGIKTSITTKLLELLLQIEKEYPTVDKINENPDIKSGVNSIVNNFMGTFYHIQSSGNGNLLNTGSHSQIGFSTKVNKDNREGFIATLQAQGINEIDGQELVHILNDEDQPDHGFGPRVQSWLQNQLARTMNGNWPVSLAKAAQILEDAINSYRGNTY